MSVRFARSRPVDARATTRVVPRRSNAAAYVALGLLLVGVVVGTVTILVPAFLGVTLVLAGCSFLGTRLNPLTTGFYLPTRPSWPAIGTVFLSGGVLIGAAYYGYVRGWAPLLP